MKTLKPQSWLLFSLLAFSIGVDLAWYGWVGFVRDDAYITFRYAQNLAHGLGFVYNVGERVYGASSPGMALLLAAWLRVFHNSVVAAIGLDILAGTLSLAIVWKLLELFSIPVSQRVLIVFILLWSDKLLLEMLAGMEVPLVILCMMASLYLMTKERPIWAGLAAGWMLWMRLDTALWIAALAAVCFWSQRRSTLIFLAVTGLAYLPWLIFAQLYFGSVIPFTAIAKRVAYGWSPLPWTSRFQILFGWLAPFTILDHPSLAGTLALITDGLALAGVWIYRRVIWVRALALFFALQTTMLIALNMTVEQRYFITSLYVLLILSGLGIAAAWRGLRRRWLKGAVAAVYIVSAFNFALPRMEVLHFRQEYANDRTLTEIGMWLKQNTPEDAVVYLEPLGYVGYYSERTMLDDVGLLTPDIVPLKAAHKDSFEVVETLLPDYVVLHCDDAEQAPADFGYRLLVRFDPLDFMSGEKWQYPAVQRTACYQINKRLP